MDSQLETAVSGLTNELNVTRSMSVDPLLKQRFLDLGSRLVGEESLIPSRIRELVILRVAWRCNSNYEFSHHAQRAESIGFSRSELERLASEGHEGWTEGETAVIRMADELCLDNGVASDTWFTLQGTWTQVELLHLIYIAGLYRLVAGFLNSAGIELDEGVLSRFGAPS